MGRGKSYVVAGLHFSRQGDLDAAVKAHLNRHPLNKPFRDDFLAAVINELHPDVIAAGQQSTGEFEYLDYSEQVRRGMTSALRFRGGKVVITRFEPLGEWRDVTVYPWRRSDDPRQDIKRALREKLAPYLPKPQRTDRCARAGCAASGAELEYEYIAPTFDTMADACLVFVSADELATKFGYSKFRRGCDELAYCIPLAHPAFQELLALHRSNQWEWLCAYHHRNVGAGDIPSQLSLIEIAQ